MKLDAVNGVLASAFLRAKYARPPRSQATKATQMLTMFAGYLRPDIVGGPHSNRNSVP